MRPAIAKRVRQLVAKRAKYSYEYCKVHEGDSYLGNFASKRVENFLQI